MLTGLFIMSIACFFIYRFADLHFSSKIKISSNKDINARRGYIKDRNGYILAISIEKKSLFANPQEIYNPDELAKVLSPVIGLSEKYILSRIKRDKRFVWIKRKIEDEEVKRIEKLNLKGLDFRKEYHRVYPHGKLASNILGFVDPDNNGLDGLEYKFNDMLLPSERSGIFTMEGQKKAYNVILTIDRYIQYISEREIKQAVIQNKALQGAAVVLEVKTGKILAIAKYPNFDPNYYYKYSDEARGNYTVVNSFEPGSTFKIIALAAILENNPEALKKVYNCTGSIDIWDATINCTKIHGKVNLTEIIKESCNVGIIQAMKPVSKKDFYAILKDFGFGDKTGIDLPGESAGILGPVKDWSGLSKYSISIGHEISVTSLQLVSSFGAIANGGMYIYPTIIERIEGDDGVVIQNNSPRVKGKIINSTNSDIILKMMRSVVTGGTGRMADFEYYKPAGKTGTSRKSTRAGYYEKYVASFIGVAPYNDPDICVLVILDEPNISIYGGEVAAPVFSKIASKVLVYRGKRIKKITAKEPLSIESQERKFDDISMPSFKGLSLSESIQLLIEIQKKYNIKYYFIGQGKVYNQVPDPGIKLTNNQEIVLYLRNIQ